MDDYKYIEKVDGEHVLENLEGEKVSLQGIFTDMYMQTEDSIDIGMSESRIARKYDLDENQVAEAQNFFRDQSDSITDINYLESADNVFEVVEELFYGLSSKYEDVDMEVQDSSEQEGIGYVLNVDGDELEADIENDHIYLTDKSADITLKVAQEEAVHEEIITLYNSLRFQDES